MASYRSARSHVGWFTKLSLTLILVLVLRQNGTQALKSFGPSINCGPNSVYPESCKHGSFSINFNPEFCLPRTLCRKGVGEVCREYGGSSDCKPGLYCNCYHRCSENPDICPFFGNGILDLNTKN
ncbi:uncharacterized protein LOC105233855 [Bactrocera dorsalis]|uniref:Uncharacterized protein LOC105233855 n=1 Tax=Bactrocera dorsalis TaxID=27457 RepID=A0A6J0RLN0_BACDO|nr:uncharacterized protein LOC105233855 [Bactrocera dorsalis]